MNTAGQKAAGGPVFMNQEGIHNNIEKISSNLNNILHAVERGKVL